MPTVDHDSTRESAPAKSLRTAVLLVFLLYFATPALWVFFAITKDPSQIFTTFGLWFAKPLHFFDNVSELFSYQGGIYARWFGNSIIYATTISAVSTMARTLSRNMISGEGKLYSLSSSGRSWFQIQRLSSPCSY
jgi:ABC-type glycerol-3-phosphate transport system permease component